MPRAMAKQSLSQGQAPAMASPAYKSSSGKAELLQVPWRVSSAKKPAELASSCAAAAKERLAAHAAGKRVGQGSSAAAGQRKKATKAFRELSC